ncbi:Deoxyhypusine hydroxylase [Amphibalanus amphitrite]|uniref:Deoxyhypusine hydroxylase n=1 Tax=Amphibalanus amphitrite TaxID=1232801 RepID=A0A6A4W3M6_AMPAM|nr:Deoxyhypusine hydroxylase [Amphibalanus amphitrite]
MTSNSSTMVIQFGDGTTLTMKIDEVPSAGSAPAAPLATPEQLRAIGAVLRDPARPLKERFRALFTLRNLPGAQSVQLISEAFSDESALLKHELAYCLGQMGDRAALPVLTTVLENTAENPMVRHEAGEAMGAIGDPSALPVLTRLCSDPTPEVAETCQLAVRRIKWLQDEQSRKERLSENPYASVDPAPPADEPSQLSCAQLRATLLDDSVPLFERYRAMFTLRNRGDAESVTALADGLRCGSALFRHEIAYVLGQVAHPAATKQLETSLRDQHESDMVRHECAEALGAIGTPECLQLLSEYGGDQARVVRESVEVALDMCEYEQSAAFQYADGLTTSS